MQKRQYKQGIDRQQGYLLPPSVEEYVPADNPVRAIDSYVDSLDLAELGFGNTGGELTPGQPAYAPHGLLKLYLYGYLHRMRCSRRLEAECQRNLEVIWLVQGLQPSYKTIADFRKDNLEALKPVNQDFVQLCKELDLFGAELVGIDGSFFRGNVAKDHIYTAERLQRSLGTDRADIARYLEELDQADRARRGQPARRIRRPAEKLDNCANGRRSARNNCSSCRTVGQTQIAEVDEDARLLRKARAECGRLQRANRGGRQAQADRGGRGDPGWQ